ncbi:MAG: ABC transporter substrate-binding protein, partial [Sciscionella sp.]
MTRSVRSRRHRYAAAAGAVAALFAFTACSSSGSGSSGGGGPSGSTIKLGMISDVGTTVDYADAVAAAKAAVRGVNARGGIDGRKVELEFCNESLDPNKAAACARKLVSDKVMAFVGNQIVTYEQNADKLFAQAGIPNIGPVSYGPSGQDSNSYLLSPGQEYVNAAQAMAAVRYGGKKVALIRLDVPFTAPFESFYGKALAKLGGTKGVTAVIPATGQPDLAASASRLESSHPDVVNTNGNEIADTEILKSMAGLGYQGKMVVAADLFRYASLKQLGTLANRVIFA